MPTTRTHRLFLVGFKLRCAWKRWFLFQALLPIRDKDHLARFGQASTLQRPTTSDPEVWKAYWKAQDQPWRTEPEIDTKRQKELAQRRAVIPDIEKGIYPFRGMKLSRADVEWLLATHESEGITGPVDWSDESQRDREGTWQQYVWRKPFGEPSCRKPTLVGPSCRELTLEGHS